MQTLINAALNASRESFSNQYPHGAAISLGGKIIAQAANGSTSLCHAEAIAIKKGAALRALS